MKLPTRTTPLARALLALGLATAAGLCAADQPEGDGQRPAAATWCADRCDAVVTDWSLTALHVMKVGGGYQNPLVTSRALAMMHLAMHDAVNTVKPRYRRYAPSAAAASGPADRADPAVAAAWAAHTVLVALYPEMPTHAIAEHAVRRMLLEAGEGPEIAAAYAVGKAAGQAVLAKRSNDGSNGSQVYTEGTLPGQYRYTPPFNFVLGLHWRHVTPFALTSPSQFRTPPPPPLASEQYRRDFDEVKRVGGKAPGAQRSTDETNYAAFWYEYSDMGWNRVARAASVRIKQDLWERARTFALLNAAMADSYIAGWDSKFLHNSRRPVTAIHLAGSDGNPHTMPDAAYDPFLTTPPVPDMPSTHSVLGMAAATVLAQSFGRDQVRFSYASSSALPRHPVRGFNSFSEAARENADSRIRAGLHFRFATQAGLEMGRQIGHHVSRHALPRMHGAATDGE